MPLHDAPANYLALIHSFFTGAVDDFTRSVPHSRFAATSSDERHNRTAEEHGSGTVVITVTICPHLLTTTSTTKITKQINEPQDDPK